MSKKSRSSTVSLSRSTSFGELEEQMCIELEPEYINMVVPIKEEAKYDWECSEFGESVKDSSSEVMDDRLMSSELSQDELTQRQFAFRDCEVKPDYLEQTSHNTNTRSDCSRDRVAAKRVGCLRKQRTFSHTNRTTLKNTVTTLTCDNTTANLHSMEIKPYTCATCNKGFTQECKLKRHERIHTGEKPYSCDVCKTSFTQLSHLKVHKRVHSGERPYSCDICKQKFKQVSNLKVHERVHYSEKPYSCKICNKRFTQASHLKGHELVHTSEKPYGCELCEKKFKALKDLKRHKRDRHAIET